MLIPVQFEVAARHFTPAASPQIISFPENLRDWMPEPRLAMMIADAVEEMPHPSAQFKVLLAVIAYSYATGVYSSAEIESSLRLTRNPFACPDEEWEQAIRQYRRTHREKIERCLAEVLRRAFYYRDAEDEVPLCRPGVLDEDPFAQEAAGRLGRAIRFDCWALDY